MRTLAACLALTLLLVLAASAPAEALPANHDQLMKNEDYRSAYERYTAALAEARDRLTDEEYRALADGCEKAVAENAAESVKGGTDQAEAYAAEYWARNENISRELVWDYLRKNAEGVQGLYRFQSEGYDGYLTVQAADDPGVWAVEISAIMTGDSENSGEVQGLGRLDGNRMAVNYGDDEAEKDGRTVDITFDGETARVATSEGFKRSGWLGHNVVIDGDYLREKK